MKSCFGIFFINKEEAIQLHAKVIARFGGKSGMRDITLLESAIDQPLKALEYGDDEEKEIEYLASTYLFHIIKNHAFVDGNKRTGLLVTIEFLKRNSFVLEIESEKLYKITLDTAESRLSKREVAQLFRAGIKQI
jgi:death-on-curing protein